jgi:hypothetical protein
MSWGWSAPVVLVEAASSLAISRRRLAIDVPRNEQYSSKSHTIMTYWPRVQHTDLVLFDLRSNPQPYSAISVWCRLEKWQ